MTKNKVNVTFSFDKELYEDIKKEADSEHISLNPKVVSILEMYAKFYRVAARFESKTIPHTQFAAMLELMDERELIEVLTNMGNQDVLSSFHQLNIPIASESLIKYCFEEGTKWTGFYSSFDYHVDDKGFLTLVFGHNLGLKWSGIIASVLSDLIQVGLTVPTQYQALANAAIIKVMDKQVIPTTFGEQI